jgi:carboxymethylenebutenolidase
MPEVRFAANGSETTGYLAQPVVMAAPGVVVLQEWWGLDDHSRSVPNRLGTYDYDTTARPWKRRVAFPRDHLAAATG